MHEQRIPHANNGHSPRPSAIFAGIKLFSFAGIPVYARPSLFLVLAMLTALLGLQFFPGQPEYAGYGAVVYFFMGLAAAGLFFFSVLLHELAHCLLARTRLGGGIPIRRITLFFLGGLSEMTEEPRTAGGEFLISFSGPFTSIALGAVMWPGAGLLAGAGTPVFVTGVIHYIGYLNVFLGVTNLLPGFPLDGGRVLRATIWYATGDFLKATRISTAAGRALGYSAIAAGMALTLIGGGQFFVQAIVVVLAGMFVERSARQVMAFARSRAALEGLRARDAMHANAPPVREDATLACAAQNCMAPYHAEAVAVLDEAEHLRGVLTANMLEKVPGREWQTVRAGDLFEQNTLPAFARPDEPLPSVYTLMLRYGLAALPVLDGEGRVEGIITLNDLHRMAAFRARLPRGRF